MLFKENQNMIRQQLFKIVDADGSGFVDKKISLNIKPVALIPWQGRLIQSYLNYCVHNSNVFVLMMSRVPWPSENNWRVAPATKQICLVDAVMTWI